MAVVAAIAFVLVALVIRTQPVTSFPRLVIAVGSVFVPLVAVLAFGVALLRRLTLLALIAGLVAACALAIQVRWYYLGSMMEVGDHKEFRILSANLRHGQADPESFVGIAARNADVITVAELTEESVQRFNQAGIEREFPHSMLEPAPGSGGIGIWSRYPLTPVTAVRHRGVKTPAARLTIPGLDTKPLVASVHVYSPVAGKSDTVELWRASLRVIETQLEDFAKAAGPAALIVGGDFNSTPDMRQFRDLLTNGYRDAVEETGSGFSPTFKEGQPIPPLITIDHVLTRNAGMASVKTVTIDGTDHRALVGVVLIPISPK